jgi:hypothetical protein
LDATPSVSVCARRHPAEAGWKTLDVLLEPG